MKKVMVVLVIALLAAPMVSAQSTADKINVSLDLTYVSKWLSKGAEGYGEKGGLFKTIDFDLYGSGFGVKVTHRNATSSGYVDKERFDFRPYYKGTAFAGEVYETKYNASVGYEYYPGLARTKANTTYEWILALKWPNLISEDLIPWYIMHYETPESHGNANRNVDGWVHRFGMNYNIHMSELSNPIVFSSEIAYYDGLGGSQTANDWAYATFGLSSKFEITEDMAFVPGIYHQITMDNSINGKDDITYCMLSMKYDF